MSSYSDADDLSFGQGNPFEITKGRRFHRPEIDQLWVDWPAPGVSRSSLTSGRLCRVLSLVAKVLGAHI